MAPIPETQICGQCREGQVPFDQARSLYVYAEPLTSGLHRFKYQRQTNLAPTLGALLSQGNPYSMEEVDWIAPVPLHIKRLRERTFNQALLLARALQRASGRPLAPRILVRARPTPSQTGLKPKERDQNVQGAFSLSPGARASIKGKTILLVDDIYTTGATVKACARILRKGGAKHVWVLTLARAVKF